MGQVKIRNEKILSDEHYVLKQVEFDIQKSDGEWQNLKREVYDHGNAVAVLLYNTEIRTVILVKQFRLPTYINGNPTGMLTEVPAGLLDKNEGPDTAIIREVKEQTGYEIDKVEKVFEAYSSAGSLTELIHYYVASYKAEQKKSEGGGLADEGEMVTVMEVSFEDVAAMVKKGEIKDAKTLLLVQHALLKNFLQ